MKKLLDLITAAGFYFYTLLNKSSLKAGNAYIVTVVCFTVHTMV